MPFKYDGDTAAEVEQFLTHLAVNLRVASSTQNQALSAILFLYKQILGIELPWLNNVTRAKRPEKLPVVFSKNEIKSVMANLGLGSGQAICLLSLKSRGRNAGYPAPPAQTRTCGFPASGSSVVLAFA